MPAHRARVRMGAFLRNRRGTRQFRIEMSICGAQWMDDLIGIIMRDDRHRFLSAIWVLEIVVRNRPDRLERSYLGRDWRTWPGDHFRHVLLSRRCGRFGDHFRDLVLSDWRVGNHFPRLFHGDRWFLFRDYLGRYLLRYYLRCFPGDHLNGILLCRLFPSGKRELGRCEGLRVAGLEIV